MIRAGTWMGLFLISCGGAATPKAEAPEEPAPTTTTHDDADTSKAPAEAKPAAEEKSEDTSKGTSSEDELKTILQLVIEDSELDAHMHLTEPGRFPLKMTGKDLPSGIALTKAGQPVKIVAGEPAKKDAVLVITKIEVSGKEATVGYRFDIEGLVGTAHLKKASYGWELSSSRVVEHYKADPGKK